MSAIQSTGSYYGIALPPAKKICAWAVLAGSVVAVALVVFRIRAQKKQFADELTAWCEKVSENIIEAYPNDKNLHQSLRKRRFIAANRVLEYSPLSPLNAQKKPQVLNLNNLDLSNLPPIHFSDRRFSLTANNNPISTTPDLSLFRGVVMLSLCHCGFTEPPDITELAFLVFLDLSENDISEIPKTHPNPPEELKIVLRENLISKLSQDIANHPRYELDIRENPLSEQLRSWIQEHNETGVGPIIIVEEHLSHQQLGITTANEAAKHYNRLPKKITQENERPFSLNDGESPP